MERRENTPRAGYNAPIPTAPEKASRKARRIIAALTTAFPDTPDARRRIMRAIKSRDTAPELFVRRLAYGMGYRYRLHRKDLPGTPDLAFPGMRKAIFVHGCFWHCHDCGQGARVPKQNRSYWKTKLLRTQERDAAAHKALTALGWKVTVFWECELRDQRLTERKLRIFLR